MENDAEKFHREGAKGTKVKVMSKAVVLLRLRIFCLGRFYGSSRYISNLGKFDLPRSERSFSTSFFKGAREELEVKKTRSYFFRGGFRSRPLNHSRRVLRGEI